ncbi:PKD domain-containing protein [Pedobacter montanisoli]|uniref:PKD domain-containing protein n=1 Tax=Pedobacter montanisoli TaxID=2923277 RepID=A0ABS9ZZD0_9SPHI|nr:gliding motility-associated C-terminal domain-containing protein [Pedobacter montanisoli]MCJ0743663.1 PKD domain-containing protein [Pedobacter montanisoli]
MLNSIFSKCKGFWVLSFFIVLNIHGAFAQYTSNKGTDFWLAYTGHIDGLASRMTLFLSSDVNTDYTVTIGTKVIASGTVTANVVTPVFINPNTVDVYIGTSDQVEKNKAVHVTTTQPVSLYEVISNNARTGSTLVLPTSALENQYYTFSYENGGTANIPPYSQFTIVSIEDNTKLEILPTQTSSNANRKAGQAFQLTLNKGEIYQFQASGDVSGTYIKSTNCKAFAVFSGSTWTAFCESGSSRNPSGGDNLLQQMFPVSSWGKNFVSAPFYNTEHGNSDVIRIIVAEDNTTVNINGSTSTVNGITLKNPYSKGSMITFSSKTANVIKSDHPIAVAQYQTSQTCNINNHPIQTPNQPFPGDPEMTILNPIEQTLKDITVYSKLNSVTGVNTNIINYYLNIIIKTADINGFTLDGNNFNGSFKTIPNSDYSYAVIDVTGMAAQHRLKADGGFVAIAYGYGTVESYAYLAGTDLKNLSSNIKMFEQGSSVASTNFCAGTDFESVLQLPFLTDKIIWNLNNGKKVETINTPAYTTYVVDGTTYYLYKYNVPASYFAQGGTFELTATVVPPAGKDCSSEQVISTKFDVFKPDFSLPAAACINASIDFKNLSLGITNTTQNWKWDFGDGEISTDKDTKHAYTTPGEKEIKLYGTTETGCALFITKKIMIIDLPVADFEIPAIGCSGNKLTFINKTLVPQNTAIAYQWDFGDGTAIVTSETPEHVYTKEGTYKVKLTATTGGMCSQTIEKDIVVNLSPTVDFDLPESCVADMVSFEGRVLSGNITAWSWDFGDGSNDLSQRTLQNPKHKYNSVGKYTVKVTATDLNGCSVTLTKQVVINGATPLITEIKAKSDQTFCTNSEILFEQNSSVSFGSITRVEWIFDYKAGKNNTASTVAYSKPQPGQIFSHKYPNTGKIETYNVVMVAYSGQNCYTTSNPIQVTVYPAPVVKIENVPPLCEYDSPVQLIFNNENNVPVNAVFTGKGVSASGLFSPAIAGPGKFDIKVVFTTDHACTDEKTFSIEVNENPQIIKGDDMHIILGGEKKFNVGVTGNKLIYKWSPSDGLSSDTELNPVASPDKTTTYTLEVKSDKCTTYKTFNVFVHENPDIPNVFSPNGDGKNDTWNIKYLETIKEGTVTIFNRYGQKVFFAKPYTTPWDGRFNGIDVPVGVYYYIIEPNNGRKRYTGSVTVLR